MLANLDDEIGLREAGVVQNMVNSGKETTEVVLETQVMEGLKALAMTANLDSGKAVPSKGPQQIKATAGASLAKANKHGIARTQKEAAVAEETEDLELKQGSEEQGPPRSRASGSLQHQGPPGAREQETRTAGGESFRERSATEAFRSGGARSKGRRSR